MTSINVENFAVKLLTCGFRLRLSSRLHFDTFSVICSYARVWELKNCSQVFSSSYTFLLFRTLSFGAYNEQIIFKNVYHSPLSLETSRRLEPKWVPQLFLGLLLGTPTYLPIFFPLSPATEAEAFANVSLAKFPSRF